MAPVVVPADVAAAAVAVVAIADDPSVAAAATAAADAAAVAAACEFDRPVGYEAAAADSVQTEYYSG